MYRSGRRSRSRSRSQWTEEVQLKKGRSCEWAPCNAIHTQSKQTMFRTPTVSQPLQLRKSSMVKTGSSSQPVRLWQFQRSNLPRLHLVSHQRMGQAFTWSTIKRCWLCCICFWSIWCRWWRWRFSNWWHGTSLPRKFGSVFHLHVWCEVLGNNFSKLEINIFLIFLCRSLPGVKSWDPSRC